MRLLLRRTLVRLDILWSFYCSEDLKEDRSERQTNIFHNIMAAFVKGNPKPKPKKESAKKKA